jgi:hypothetical protein
MGIPLTASVTHPMGLRLMGLRPSWDIVWALLGKSYVASNDQH